MNYVTRLININEIQCRVDYVCITLEICTWSLEAWHTLLKTDFVVIATYCSHITLTWRVKNVHNGTVCHFIQLTIYLTRAEVIMELHSLEGEIIVQLKA